MQRFLGYMMLVVVLCGVACASMKTPQGEAVPAIPEPAGGWQAIQPKGVAGLGTFANDPNLVIDGKFVRDQTLWNDAKCVWWTGVQAQIVVDLGKPCTVGGVVIQLSSDNDYEIMYSVKGFDYRRLALIGHGDFKLRWGMDTVSSLPGRADTVPGMAFQPVKARYLKIQALGGENEEYSVSEIEVFGACDEAPK
jgi:hypothetical protein